jgi:catechol 2,3-dioxygenase-like lactoylglutathione lyase family enzyme
MIKVNEIAFAAYPVTDKQRARDFYEGLLGLKPTMDSVSPEGYWIEYDIGNGTLAISNFWKPAAAPAMGPAAALEVENFDYTVALLKTKDVPFRERYILWGPYVSERQWGTVREAFPRWQRLELPQYYPCCMIL